MSGRRSRIWLVPTAELVCETAADLPLSGPRLDLSGTSSDPDPLVYVTPEWRVIAGQAYVKASQESGRSAILCWVIADDDLGAALTRIHNQILFRRLGTDALHRHLQVYSELCLYSHASSGVSAFSSSGSAQTSDAEESHSSGSDPSDTPPPPAGDVGDDPWSGAADGEDAISEPDGRELGRWHQLDRFWYP